MKLKHFLTKFEGTPHEQTFYATRQLNVIGWEAGDEPFTWKVIVNRTRLKPQQVIDTWLDALNKCVNEDADRSTLNILDV